MKGFKSQSKSWAMTDTNRQNLRPISGATVHQLYWTPHRLASAFWGGQREVEGGAGLQHGASDVEKAIGNRSQSPAMTMPPAAQGGVFGFARFVMLNGDCATNGTWRWQAGYCRLAFG